MSHLSPSTPVATHGTYIHKLFDFSLANLSFISLIYRDQLANLEEKMTFSPPLFYVKMLVSMSNCVGVAGRSSQHGYCAGWSSSHERLNVTIDAMTTDIFFKTLTLLLDHVPAFFLFMKLFLLILMQRVRFYFMG